jgi:hypothetical protein
MSKSSVVCLLGPEDAAETVEALLAASAATDFSPCAFVDPSQGHRMMLAGRLPVYNDLPTALSETRASTVVYGDWFVDVNGVGRIDQWRRVREVS